MSNNPVQKQPSKWSSLTKDGPEQEAGEGAAASKKEEDGQQWLMVRHTPGYGCFWELNFASLLKKLNKTSQGLGVR